MATRSRKPQPEEEPKKEEGATPPEETTTPPEEPPTEETTQEAPKEEPPVAEEKPKRNRGKKEPKTPKPDPDESKEPVQDKEEPETVDFINCDEFNLIKLTDQGDRTYGVEFTADAITGSCEKSLNPDSDEEAPFEKVFKDLGEMIFPQLFADQNTSKLSLVYVHKKTKTSKKKDPVTEFCFKVQNLSGKGYTSQSKPVNINHLPDRFKELFNELENFLWQELRKKKRGPVQQNIFDQPSEEDEGEGDED